jgi:hypothetical protein
MLRLLARSLALSAALAGTAAAQGGAFATASSGNITGSVVTPAAKIISALKTGTVDMTTTTGGQMTIKLPAAAGVVIERAVLHPSAANGTAAAHETQRMLSAAGMPGSVVSAAANAVHAIGAGSPTTVSSASVTQAVASVRTAMVSGSMTPDEARAVTAFLVALRAAASGK